MITHLARLRDIVLDILFPAVCLGCAVVLSGPDRRATLCQICFNSLDIYTTAFCPICRGRLPNLKRFCHKEADYVLLAATSYERQSVRSLIWHLKFRRHFVAARTLSDIMSRFINGLNLDLNDFVIIPIPLHRKKQRERGFNQVELIAKELIKTRPIGLATDALIKHKKTDPQSTIKDWDKRQKNLRGSFSIINPEAIKNRNIILLDDVWTSGTTMNEAARVLKQAGANKIIGLVICKAG